MAAGSPAASLRREGRHPPERTRRREPDALHPVPDRCLRRRAQRGARRETPNVQAMYRRPDAPPLPEEPAKVSSRAAYFGRCVHDSARCAVSSRDRPTGLSRSPRQRPSVAAVAVARYSSRSSFVTTPAGCSPRDRDERRRAAAQQGERLVERRGRVHERQRRLHHLADGPFDDRRVADRPGRGGPSR